MRQSLTGGWLPESEEEFQSLLNSGQVRYKYCTFCNRSFTQATVWKPAGWAETQISGTCDSCWEEIFKDADEVDADKGEEK